MAGRFSPQRGWIGLQREVERAGNLYNWRILVTDRDGNIVADSHEHFGSTGRDLGSRASILRIVNNGQDVGSLSFVPNDRSFSVPELPPTLLEPTTSQLASVLNRSLIWAGLAAGAGGIFLISIMTRRILSPVGVLSAAAARLGQGDLSQRVPRGRDEIGQLGATFNVMAEGLENAQAQRRNLMADVAHELRTPLSNIQGYLEAIRDGLLEPSATTIETIHQQVVHLSRLVEDVRLLSLAESGALRLDVRPDSLTDVLVQWVESFKPKAEAEGIVLSLDMPAEYPLVMMDRTRIGQVLNNLLENAIVHTPQAGRITVTLELTGRNTARVTVGDTGEGISAEDQPHVFDRFYRADPSRSRATGGAGLGLTIAKYLVESHGGTLQVESTIGEGSRFIFELPLNA